MRAVFVLAGFLALSLVLAGCGTKSSPDRAFVYAEDGFSATVSGSVTRMAEDGYTGEAHLVGDSLRDVSRDFEAVVSVRTQQDAEGAWAVSFLSVRYTAPAALCGVTVTYVHDGGAGPARVTLTRAMADGVSGAREITADLSATGPAVRDALLAPAGVLLPAGDIAAVSPAEGGRYTVTRRDGNQEAVFTFESGQSLPVSVSWRSPARAVEVTVTG